MANELEIKNRILNLVTIMEKMTPKDPNNQKYLALVNGVEELAQKYIKLSTPKFNGGYEPVKEDAFDDLKKTYEKVIGLAAEITKEPKSKNKSVKARQEIAGTIQNLLTSDLSYLTGVKANDELTFPEIMENARIPVVEMNDLNVARESGTVSVRIPLKYTDENGNVIEGYFTESNDVKPYNDYTVAGEFYDSLSENDKQYGEIIKKIYSPDENNNMWELPDACETHVGTLKNPQPMDDEFLDAIAKVTSPERANELRNDENFLRVARSFVSTVEMKHAVSELNDRLGFEGGENLDNRNSAMSIVADLIGCSDLIAKSRPMKLKVGDKIISGTLMETVKGKDLNKLEENDPMLSYPPENYDNPNVNRKLCDLQILDHICGNVDRHEANIIYQFDENGKVTDIKGIDNDTSFIKKSLNPSKPSFNNMAVLDDDVAISEATANKILHLTDDMLRVSLKGTKLDDTAIDFAVERLHQVQERITADIEYFKDKSPTAIEEGHIHIIKDEDWQKIPLKELALNNEAKQAIKENKEIPQHSVMKSPLGRMYKLNERVEMYYLNGHKAPNQPEKAVPIGKTGAEQQKAGQLNDFKLDKAMLLKELQLVTKNMNDADPRLVSSSKNFKDTKASLAELYRKVEALTPESDENTLRDIRDAYRKTSENAQIYVQSKKKETGRSSLANKRLSAVSDVFAVTDSALERLNNALGEVRENNKTAANRLAEEAKENINRELASDKPDGKTVFEGIATVIYSQALKAIPGENFNQIQYGKVIGSMHKDENLLAMIKRVGATKLCNDIKAGKFENVSNEYKRQAMPKAKVQDVNRIEQKVQQMQ